MGALPDTANLERSFVICCGLLWL
jgi:hypothetical protein